MEESTALACVTVGLLIVLTWRRLTDDKGSKGKGKSLSDIPTVPGLPIIGNALQINRKRPDLTFIAWAKQYGPVYKVKIFNKTMIVLSRYEEVHEVLVTRGTAYAGRNETFKIRALTSNPKQTDIINGTHEESHWLAMRKTSHRGIRHYGNGMPRLEKTLAVMAQTFVDRVRLHEGKPIDLRDDLYTFIVMVSVTMICGKQVTDETDDMVTTMKTVERYMTSILTGEGMELDFYPWLRHFGHPTYRKILEYYEIRDRLWESMWEESQRSYTSAGDASCILHAIAQMLDKNSPYYEQTIQVEHAKGLFSGLVLASIITTSTFLYILPNILLHNPEVLKRIQEEVDEVIGADRQPSIFDRDSMPYSVATIFELLRYSSSLTTISHMAIEDTKLGEYDVPAGTTMFLFPPIIMHDKEFWGDPDVFRPDRFLDTDGSLVPADHPNRKRMLEFGSNGPRSCVGEAFAQKRMFIFLTSLVQAFDLLPGCDTLVPCDYESYEFAGLLRQRPYTIKLMPRH